jgi:outer membrane protein assembly factor BamE (lipoprotein component of BamABCDE complex)
MYKGDVLELLGSPQESKFKGDQYIWIYKYLDEDKPIFKEIHVKNDFVTYAGEPVSASNTKFGKISKGMSKSEVLDVLGFPAKTEKRGGKDVWTYTGKDASADFQVQFGDDKVTELGVSVPAANEAKTQVVEPPVRAAQPSPTAPPAAENFEKIE